MNSAVVHLLRASGSAVATLGGVALLVADSVEPQCTYASLRTEFDYASSCPLENSGGNPSKPSGHVVMNLTAGHGTPEADDQSLAALQSAGLNAIFAPLDYTNCTDTAPGRVHGVVIQIGTEWSPESQFQCTRLWLPVTNQQTVNCTPMVDAGAQSCTITFSPSPG